MNYSPSKRSSIRTDGGQEQLGIELSADCNIEDIINAIPLPIYVLDADNTVIGWSDGLEPLLGLSREEMLGTDEYFGRDEDGNRMKTLGNRVVESPESASDHERVERVDSEYTEGTVYESSTWLINDADEERFIRFNAVPIRDEDGNLESVVQICIDETEQKRKQDATERLVEELIDTLSEIRTGNLSARASFETEGYVESHLLDVLDNLNDMTEEVESLVAGISDQTSSLSAAADESAQAADAINDLVTQQTESMDEAVNELENFSARMEEVAANSDQVVSAANNARDASKRGLSAGKEAQASSERLVEQGDELRETVGKLEADMDRIEDVIDVIRDIADQTNILALNASIEAARAGEAGEGFAVVADEVKTLAQETGSNASKISTQIEEVQSQTTETVESITEVNREIKSGMEQVRDAVEAFEHIEELVDEVSQGIQEIATANDGQAKNVEEVTAMLDDVREHAQDSKNAARSIVDQVSQQQEAVEQLDAHVEELVSGTGVSAHDQTPTIDVKTDGK